MEADSFADYVDKVGWEQFAGIARLRRGQVDVPVQEYIEGVEVYLITRGCFTNAHVLKHRGKYSPFSEGNIETLFSPIQPEDAINYTILMESTLSRNPYDKYSIPILTDELFNKSIKYCSMSLETDREPNDLDTTDEIYYEPVNTTIEDIEERLRGQATEYGVVEGGYSVTILHYSIHKNPAGIYKTQYKLYNNGTTRTVNESALVKCGPGAIIC